MAHTPPPKLESARIRARNCLLTNLLVLPGLGSLMARRRVGWLQAVTALAGFALTVTWFTSFIKAWVQTGELPMDGGPLLKWGLIGCGLFVAGWIWALATGWPARLSGSPPGVAA